MLKLLGNRNFSLLWWGGLISILGNWMLLVSLPIYIYQETVSSLATSLMFIAGTVPRILLGSIAGVFVDRLDYKRTMVGCNVLLAVTVIPLFWVSDSGNLWPIYAVSFSQSLIGLFFSPAENAFLPSLVGQSDLIRANALNALNNNLARLIGPAIGGLIVSRFELMGVLTFDLVSYLLAGTLIALVKTSAEMKRDREPGSFSGATWVSQWREGLAQIRSQRVMTVTLCAVTLAALGEGSFSVLFAPFVSEAFSGGTLEFGWVMSAQAVGGFAGGVLIGSFKRLEPIRLLAFGMVYLGLIDLVMFNYTALVASIVPLLVLMVIVGIPAAAIGTGYATLLQIQVEGKFLGRVFSMVDAISALALLVGMVAAGFLGDLLGVMTLIKFQGVAHALAGLFMWAGITSRNKPEQTRKGLP